MRGQRYSPVRFQRADHSFQQIWNATNVLPVPVAIVRRSRLPTLQYRFNGSIDGDLLIVAFVFAKLVIERRKQALADLLPCDAIAVPVALPDITRFRVLGDARFGPGEVVNFDDVVPVGRVREFQAEHLGVASCLLHGIGGCPVARRPRAESRAYIAADNRRASAVYE